MSVRWIRSFDLFLFDMDGLLVDTERLHYRAYQTLCREYNGELPWDFAAYAGVAHVSHDGLERALLPLLGGEDWAQLYSRKREIYQDLLEAGELALMPGVAELLKALARVGTKRCVVTHSNTDQVGVIKRGLPLLETIPVWITREGYINPKPAVDGYAKALQLLADPTDRIVGFEDSLRGIQSLRQTVAKPVLICTPSHPQMQLRELDGIDHFCSFEAIPPTYPS